MWKRNPRPAATVPSSSRYDEHEQQVERVLRDSLERDARGAAIESRTLPADRQHALTDPDHELQLLQSARRLAQTPPGLAALADPGAAALDEELAVLRRALPRYELLDRIRRGGQGVVYRARQLGTGRIVAIKVLLDGPLATEAQRARFEREIALVARLRHPNIVNVYDSGVVRGRNFYAMEYVEGDPIDDYAALADLDPRQIVRLTIKVCEAVHHAHQNGVLHRDLNPANILVDPKGQPRVYDFGLAKDLWADGSDATYSFTGIGCGTLPYLSPEQAGGGDCRADVRSDVYALGLILYELLTDMLPYPIRGDRAAVQRAIMSTEPLSMRAALAQGNPDWAPGREQIDRDLEAIVARALAKSKDDRYESVAALAADLQGWLKGEAVAARTGSQLYRLRKTLRKYRIATAFAAVVVASFGVATAGITYYAMRARVERDVARCAAGNFFDLFGMSLTEVEEAVRPLAGGLAVRDRLISRLADRLPELQRLASSDAALASIVTGLHEKQGDIAAALGRHGEAARHYQAFLDASLRDLQAQPGALRVAANALRGYRKLAETSDAPEPLLERAAALGDELLRSEPNDEQLRNEFSQVALSYGTRLKNAGRPREALSQYERALRVCPADEQAMAADPNWVSVTAAALSGQGQTLRELGRSAEGREATGRALAVREQAVRQSPADMEKRVAFAASYAQLATECRDAGQAEEAKRLFRCAADQADYLGTADPSSTAWDGDRYNAYHRLASLCLDTGDANEANVYCEKAVAVAEHLAARDTGDQGNELLFFALSLKGRMHRSAGDLGAALRNYQQAITVRQSALDRHPDAAAILSQVVSAHDAFASTAREYGETALAIDHRFQAFETQQRLRQLQTGVVSVELNFIAMEINLASVHVDARTPGDSAEAACWLTQAETHLAALRSAGKLVGYERRSEQVKATMLKNWETLDHQRMEQLPDSSGE